MSDSNMTIDEFIKTVLVNVKSSQWLSGYCQVNGNEVGIKAYGLWVQRMNVNNGPYRDSGMGIKTQKALREWLKVNLAQLGVS